MEASRDQAIIHSLIGIADNMVENFDVVELLTKLANSCVELLGVSAAGVMLATPPDELRLVASSSDTMQVVEMFELQANEGPCLDAFHTGQNVGHENILQGQGRWPLFATVAHEAGFRSVLAIPLRLRDNTIGALNLFSTTEIPMSDEDLMVARGLADLAAISVLQYGVASEAQRVNEQLSHALTSRIVIEQAKGIVAERMGIDVAEAFARLRKYARNHGLRLADVARAAVAGNLDSEAWS